MSGEMLETYTFGEVYRSFSNAGRRAPQHFYRDRDRRKINMLLGQDGTLYPIEVKKTASPSEKDARSLRAIARITRRVCFSDI